MYQTHQVDSKSNASNNQNQFWILDLLRIQEPLDRLDGDGEAESHQEDGIDKSADNLVEKKVELLVPLR